jgi:hypothetical protein
MWQVSGSHSSASQVLSGRQARQFTRVAVGGWPRDQIMRVLLLLHACASSMAMKHKSSFVLGLK